MNAIFDKAFELVVGHEGGFGNDRADRGNWTGGAVNAGKLKGTKYGISAAAYPDLDIINISLEHAKAIYWKDYWLPAGCNNLPVGLSYILFDACVNHGVSRGVKFLQKTVGTAQDGVFGNKTLAAVLKSDLNKVLAEYCVNRMLFYTDISTFGRYKVGWTRRAFQTLATAVRMVQEPAVDQSKAEPTVPPTVTPQEEPRQLTFWQWLVS